VVLAVHIPVNDYRTASHTLSQRLSLLEMARQNPGNRFVFFTDQPCFKQSEIPSNLEIKPVKPALKNRLLQHYWYQFKLPKMLERENATAFLSLQPVASGSKQVTQFLWLSDVHELLNKQGRNFSRRSKDNLAILNHHRSRSRNFERYGEKICIGIETPPTVNADSG